MGCSRLDVPNRRRLGAAALAVTAALSLPLPAAAEDIDLQVAVDRLDESVHLIAQGRPRRDLLSELLRDAGTEIQFRDYETAQAPVPGELIGDVEALAARLLKGTNHSIQFRHTATGRAIARIVVYGASELPPPPPVRYVPPPTDRRNYSFLLDPNRWEMKGSQPAAEGVAY